MTTLQSIAPFVGVNDVSAGAVDLNIAHHWFLLGVHPNRENRVLNSFRLRGWTGYVPQVLKAMWVTRGCRRLVSRPMFPGMMFVPDTMDDIDRLKQVDGISRFIRFGDVRAAISADLMRDVVALEVIAHVPPSKRAARWKAGTLVRVESGPFVGWQGRIENLDDDGRYHVALEIFGKATPIALTEDDLSEIDEKKALAAIGARLIGRRESAHH